MTFLTKLAAASRARDSVICIGLDPEAERIPEHLGRGAQAAVRFLRRIVNATSDHVCCYKPNMAFFERYGSAGLDILHLTLQAIPNDIPVILDAKRGDVPNTAAAYAEALFDRFGADATTVAPYVGMDGIAPGVVDRRQGAAESGPHAKKRSDDQGPAEWALQLQQRPEYRFSDINIATERRLAPRGARPSGSTRVLVVEDNIEILQLIHLELGREHYGGDDAVPDLGSAARRAATRGDRYGFTIAMERWREGETER